MTINLTCTQVGALLSFYIEDKLSVHLKQFVDAHLEICPTCQAKLDALKAMVTSLREVHSKLDKVEVEHDDQPTIQYNAFKANLSAYIDNELPDDENIKVKKYIIANTKARRDLESLYTLRKLLHNSFEKTKNEMKTDYSKAVLRKIDFHEEIYGFDSFARVVALFIVMFAVFTITAVIIFWI